MTAAPLQGRASESWASARAGALGDGRERAARQPPTWDVRNGWLWSLDLRSKTGSEKCRRCRNDASLRELVGPMFAISADVLQIKNATTTASPGFDGARVLRRDAQPDGPV